MEVWLARAARVHGERTALDTVDSSLTYAQLYRRAVAAGAAMTDLGVRPGDRVALALPSPQLVPALHGCMLIGAVAVPIDLRLSDDERALRMDGCALVVEEDLPPESDPATAGADRTSATAGADRNPEETATVMFTSGTTAKPKEVQLSYQNWLWNAIGSALALGLDADERWLCPMPLAHVGGLSIQIRSAIYGTGVLLHDRFDTEAALEALMDPAERVTLVSLVPTMLARLLDGGLSSPPTLRWALLGGGPIATALLERARAASVPVAPTYGMTEACSQIVTSGYPLLGVDVRIGPDGEVLVRGNTVARGALSADGWLHTGDLGALDDRGRLSIVGRLDDTIVTGGENVAPTEVEAVLLEHPAVADAAVFGRPDPEWGEAVTARVVLRQGPGSQVGQAELRRHCAATLAAFKVPKRFEVVESLPRGVTGKLLRRELG